MMLNPDLDASWCGRRGDEEEKGCSYCGGTGIGGDGPDVDDIRTWCDICGGTGVKPTKTTSEPIEVSSDPIVAALREELAQVKQERDALVHIIQCHQPSGSPPPGGVETLAAWVLRTLHEERDALAAALESASSCLRDALRMIAPNLRDGSKIVTEADALGSRILEVMSRTTLEELSARDERMRREGAIKELEQLLKREKESLLHDPDRENAQLQAIHVERIEERAAELKEAPDAK